jgi:hypothetical protein
MGLAGMELAYTHLEFRIAIVLALAAEWEDMGGVHNPDGFVNAPKKFAEDSTCHRNSFGETSTSDSAPQICISLSWQTFQNSKDKKPKIDSSGASILVARNQKPPNGALYVLPLSASPLASLNTILLRHQNKDWFALFLAHFLWFLS